jgi:hypothetical protein
MGYLCTAVDVMALRHHRQKRFAEIQPQFNNKYGSNYPASTLWYSYDDDVANEIYLTSYNVGTTPVTNFSIAASSEEVFHLQAQGFYSDFEVNYVADFPYNDVAGGSSGTSITNGVTLRFNGFTNEIYTRDKPWLKYGISWDCYATLKQQERTLTAYDYGFAPPRPIWSSWQTVSTTPYYWYHQVEPQSGLGNIRESDTLSIPATSNTPPPEGPSGGAEPNPFELLPIGTKQTGYLGSISVSNVTTYRRGNYHHG